MDENVTPNFWDIVERQGWDRSTVRDMLMDFIVDNGLRPELDEQARIWADEENQA